VAFKLFADDAKIYAEIIDIRDVEKLQSALDLLVKWAELWQLKVAINKCFTLNIGKIPSCILGLISGTEYRIDDCILPSVASCRDLGINVSSDLSTREHVNAIVLKVHERSNMILRCFISININLANIEKGRKFGFLSYYMRSIGL